MVFKIVLLSVTCLAFITQPAHSFIRVNDIINIKSIGTNSSNDIASLIPQLARAKAAAVIRGAADIASIITTGMGFKVRALARATSSVKNSLADGIIDVGDILSKAGNNIASDLVENGDTDTMSTPGPVVVAPIGKELVEEYPVDSRMKSPVELDGLKDPVELEGLKDPVDIEKMKDRIEPEVSKSPVMVEDIRTRSPIVSEKDVAAPVMEVPVNSFPLRSVQVRVRPRVVVKPSERASLFPNVWDMLRNAVQLKANALNFGSRSAARSPIVYEIIDTPRVFQPRMIHPFRIQKK